MDFGIDDDFASVGTFYYNPKVAEMTEPILGKLSRMPENSSQRYYSDSCEIYLQKISSSLHQMASKIISFDYSHSIYRYRPDIS